ncbi:hypothetical protein Q7C36_004099 [Tachysurus vachellii]|uniref:Myocilin n=1 Tax=Tachysurus vachellii TaxID=175792 RepID=A0AA88NLR0_TACVA|nr:hypothetical protein Q7C36_004099 [Tachysurus vachellii]
MWFQDPESPGAPYGPDTVLGIDTVSSEVRELYADENLEQLVRGYPTKVLLLPESMGSTGATVYHGSLYYRSRQSPTLLRYDLVAENIVAQRELPHTGFHGQYPYSWGGYTDIDLAVDEKGLWAIYSTEKARGAIIISQLDPEHLRVIRSWETNIQKNKVANAFMVCFWVSMLGDIGHIAKEVRCGGSTVLIGLAAVAIVLEALLLVFLGFILSFSDGQNTERQLPPACNCRETVRETLQEVKQATSEDSRAARGE